MLTGEEVSPSAKVERRGIISLAACGDRSGSLFTAHPLQRELGVYAYYRFGRSVIPV
jgi:hypothetical protein